MDFRSFSSVLAHFRPDTTIHAYNAENGVIDVSVSFKRPGGTYSPICDYHGTVATVLQMLHVRTVSVDELYSAEQMLKKVKAERNLPCVYWNGQPVDRARQVDYWQEKVNNYYNNYVVV